VAERFDLVITGAGEAGQAAADVARMRGASVAIVDRELFGGSCPFWACMPFEALLHSISYWCITAPFLLRSGNLPLLGWRRLGNS
jgi:pyruvate/2-oxoglutarate dehydrogenase complex dihydrolipoamide dehydrogenase (E3) component